MNLQYKINLDGIDCHLFVSKHSLSRMVQRYISLESLFDLVEDAGEALLSLPSSSMNQPLALYCKKKKFTAAILLETQGHEIHVIVKTVFKGRTKYDKSRQKEIKI